MSVEYKYLSYKMVQDGYDYPETDDAELGSIAPHILDAFFSNPFLKDRDTTLHAIAECENKMCGTLSMFETAVVIDNVICPAQAMSALYAKEEYRDQGVGPALFSYAAAKTAPKYVLCAGISDSALPLYTMMRFKLHKFPRMMRIRKSRTVLQSVGLKGLLLSFLSCLVDGGLKLMCFKNKIGNTVRRSRYTVALETTVPEWVEDLTIRDKHKYKEAHTKEWFQWNLEHSFNGNKLDRQGFYSIKSNGKPIGFFMTKERYRDIAGGKLKDFILGAIVEWGSYDETTLRESDIYKLALPTFSKETAIIEFATTDKDTMKRMRSDGFISHGEARVAFRDKTKQLKDSSDINNWRLRYGYSDVILT